VLAEYLERAKTLEDNPKLLKILKIRKPRVELIAASSSMMDKTWTLPDGEEQRQRDERMTTMLTNKALENGVESTWMRCRSRCLTPNITFGCTLLMLFPS